MGRLSKNESGRKIFCPVCQVSFVVGEEKEAGKRIICPVCGAVLVLEKITPPG